MTSTRFLIFVLCGAAACLSACRTQKPRPLPPGAEVAQAVFPPAAPEVPVDRGPLEVIRVNPEKSKDVVESVSVTFNQPMVPLTSLEALDRLSPPLKLTPEVKGHYRWLGTRTISFVPDAPLPAATLFTATVAAGTEGISGVPMDEAHTWSFETRRPKVLSVSPGNYERWALKDSTIVLQFNQPVEPHRVAALLKVKAGGQSVPMVVKGRAMGETGAPALDKPEMAKRRVELVPRGGLPLASLITLNLEAGLQGVEGKLLSLEAFKGQFRTYGPLRVTRFSCGSTPCGVNAGVYGQFTNPVPDSEREKIKITPPLEDRDALSISRDHISLHRGVKANTRYTVRFDPSLKDIFGQRLGKAHTVTFRTGDYAPAMKLEARTLVLESAGPRRVEGRFVNTPRAKLRVFPIEAGDLASAWRWVDTQRHRNHYRGKGQKLPEWATGASSSTIQVGGKLNQPVDKSLAMPSKASGLMLAVLEAHVDNPRWRPYDLYEEGIVQVTDLGLQAWYDYDQMLVWLTRLSDTSVVGEAGLTIFDSAGKSLWQGQTDSAGLAITPALNALEGAPPYFVVAQKDGDAAFIRAGAQSLEGGQWLYHYQSRPKQSPTRRRLTGHLFSERGIYRPGEKVHLKGMLRLLDRRGIDALPGSVSKVGVEIVDSRGAKVLSQTVAVDDHGTFSVDFRSAVKGSLGQYSVSASPQGLVGVRPGAIHGSFRVDAYRAPEFRVSAAVARADHLPGQSFEGHLEGMYLFGAPMRGAQGRWFLRSRSVGFSPRGHAGYVFGGRLDWKRSFGSQTIAQGSGKLDKQGRALVSTALEPRHAMGGPKRLTLAVEVIDANRQSVAGTATATLHPAAAYFGVKTDRYVYKKGESVEAHLIGVAIDGKKVEGLSGGLTLERQEWALVSKKVSGKVVSEYTSKWISEGRCAFVTTKDVARCAVTAPRGGYYRLRVEGRDAAGRAILTVRHLWVAGDDFRRRGDDLELGLVLDKSLYEVGDTARLLLNSPFKRGRALMTISRLGLIEHRDLGVVGGNKMLEVPITEQMMPNVRIGVAIVKERDGRVPGSAVGDEGRPNIVSGAIDLRVDVKGKRIGVVVTPASKKIRPGEKTAVEVRTTAPDGSPIAAQVMVAAVDEGVLSLIGYKTPDPLKVIWATRSAELAGQDLRTWLNRGEVQLRLTDAEPRRQAERDGFGRGGGKMKAKKAAAAPSPAAMELSESVSDEDEKPREKSKNEKKVRVRSRFASTAHYVAAVSTNSDGYARVELDMPDNLTTFRVMVVANDKKDLFGSGQDQITITQPLLLRAALPRFANIGDRFMAAVVVNNETGRDGQLTMDLGLEGGSGVKLSEGASGKEVAVKAGAAVEVSWPVEVPSSGEARFTFTASLSTSDGEVHQDAVAGQIDVNLPVTTESVAAYGTTTGAIEQALAPPGEVHRDVGGLEVTLSSTMLTNLQDAIEYLVEYPYGCLEQTASRVLPLVVLRDLILRYEISGLSQEALMEKANGGIARIVSMQRYNGGFAFWPQSRNAYTWPSIYALFVLGEAAAHDFNVPAKVLEKGQRFVADALRRKRDPATGRPLGDVTLSFAAAVLAEQAPERVDVGRDLEPLFNRREALPLFARAFLSLAYAAKSGDPSSERSLAALISDLSNNAVEEASDAHFAEPKSDAFAPFFHSDNRTDAIGLMAYMKAAPDDPLVSKVARGLMEARVRGRWGNTQENAYALLALSRYADHYEKETPDFVARLWFGEAMLVEQSFVGRDTAPAESSVPMEELYGAEAESLVLAKEGPGRLYYRLGLTYAPLRADLPARENGFTIERRYESVDGQLPDAEGKTVRTKAGTYVRVHLTFVVPTQRHWVVVEDPIPAGAEPVNMNFKTSLATLDQSTGTRRQSYWGHYWRAGFDHTEMRDDAVLLFADRLAPGVYEHSYVLRTTTFGDYYLPPAKISEMYQPEVFGRTPSGRFRVD